MSKPPCPPPPGIDVPTTPAPLPPGTQRVDRNPEEPQTLPQFARQGWPQLPRAQGPAGAPPRPAQATAPARPDLRETIERTADGVEALQVLIEPPEEPSRTDMIIELLESLDNRQLRMEQRLDRLEPYLKAIDAALKRMTNPPT